MIRIDRKGTIAELRLDHQNALNPFSVAMTRQLAALCAELEADERVNGVLLWGGPGRSFSAGGDFKDLRSFRDAESFAEYLRDIVRSYQALLQLSKPLVAAIDLHAIGQGLQVALMADWRVCSERATIQMPELANGVPCPLGSAILEAHLGRAAMLQLVLGCQSLGAEPARELRLIDEVCSPEALEGTARRRLDVLTGFPQTPYRLTKRINNAGLIRRLEDVREPAAQAHAQSFFEGNADQHFAKILGDES